MKISFALKLGLLLILLLSALTSGVLWYFYSYSKSVMMDDLRQRITDVIHTGTFVIDESAREDIVALRQSLYQHLPNDIDMDVLRFAKNQPKGQFKEFLDADVSGDLLLTHEFEHLVQLLRRVQAGSQLQVSSLESKPQSNMVIDCGMSPAELIANNNNRSSVRWAYLLVAIPGVPTDEALMFLADSNYQGPRDTIVNPIGNVYLPRPVFSQPFTTGKIALSDWYKDEFDSCVSVMTASVPIKDSMGRTLAILAADYPVTQFEQRMSRLIKAGTNIAVVAFSVALLLTFVIAYWISVPLRKLRVGAEQLSKKDFAHKVQISTQDEFGVVANTMNQVGDNMHAFTQNMEELVAKRTEALTRATEKVEKLNQALEEENASLGAEVDNIIKVRSQAFQIANLQLDEQSLEINACYLASKALCGDFVVIQQRQDSTFVHLGHVSGYGLKTATLALQLQAILQYQKPSILDDVRGVIVQFMNEVNRDVPVPYDVTLSTIELKEGNVVYCDGAEKDNTYLLYSTGFRRAVMKLYDVNDDDLSSDAFLSMIGFPSCSINSICNRIEDTVWSDTWEDDISCISVNLKR